MEKTYHPQSIEQRWYQHWEQSGYFKPSGQGETYCIVIPPPNVTGSLHMGHGFQYTLMDALTRFHRMRGFNTLWQVGTDHAGIATQMVVERQLAAEGLHRDDLGREAFLEKVYEWKKTSGNRITQQMRKMGASVDWDRERFTMDTQLSHAVREAFVRLYEDGLIYRGQKLVNWDPKFHTAISDLEVVNQEEDGHLWHIRYPLSDHSGHVVVATSRPETLFGDVAVAVHPEDPRYQTLIGKTVRLPLCERDIPILADTFVEPEFGSGCVKITPAHDFNDYAVGLRHQLTPINILTPDAHLNDQVPLPYQGMERFAARKQIVKDLEPFGLIEKIEPYKIHVPRGDRSGVVIEPYLTDQWFVRVESLAKRAIDAVETGATQFVPENWCNTYFQWMHNLQDWCISRQLWWGHRIPAWYDSEKNIYVGQDEAEVRRKYGLSHEIVLTQEEDVLDTWFSAALWPFASLGWPEATSDLQQFYPTSVLVTGFDIIFFWVARMMMFGLKFTDHVPFHKVYVTGLIRDHEGQKMSKSKGNIIDPLDLIDGIDLETLVKKRTESLMQPQMAEKIEAATRKVFPEGIPAFGTDALRFTFCALASTGRDIRFDLGRVEGYRNFCNKLWNAARFVFMQLEGHEAALTSTAFEPSKPLANRWIQSRLQQIIQDTHRYFSEYRFDLLAQTLYEFFWNDFCDWYLELSKAILMGNVSETEKNQTRGVLMHTLEITLRLLHPIIPFITEEIWQKVAEQLKLPGKTIMQEAYPEYDSTRIDTAAEQEFAVVKNFIIAIRTVRSEKQVPPGKRLRVLLKHDHPQADPTIQNHAALIQSLAKLDSLHWLQPGEKIPPAATALSGNIEIYLPLADLIDKAAEQKRLQKELEKWRQEQTKIQQKLSNSSYVEKAPEAVVAKERERAQSVEITLRKLEQQLQQLSEME